MPTVRTAPSNPSCERDQSTQPQLLATTESDAHVRQTEANTPQLCDQPQQLELVLRKHAISVGGALRARQYAFGLVKTALRERVRAAALRAGRNPDALTYAYNVGVLIGDHAVPQPGRLAGSADHVADKLAEFVAHGFTCFVFWLSDSTGDQMKRLAHEVIPSLRARIETPGFVAVTNPAPKSQRQATDSTG